MPNSSLAHQVTLAKILLLALFHLLLLLFLHSFLLLILTLVSWVAQPLPLALRVGLPQISHDHNAKSVVKWDISPSCVITVITLCIAHLQLHLLKLCFLISLKPLSRLLCPLFHPIHPPILHPLTLMSLGSWTPVLLII